MAMPPEIRELLHSADAHGTSILIWVLDALTPDDDSSGPTHWHPAVLRREIGEAAHTTIPENNFDKLMAAIAVLTTDLFFKNAGAFAALATALCGGGFHPGSFDPPDAAECAWAITEALLLSPPDDADEEPFSLEVRRFIGTVLREEGFLSAPDVLGIAVGLPGRHDHGDDPELAAHITAGQKTKIEEIHDVIRDGLASLVEQIESLPLRGGNAKDLASRLRTALHVSPAAQPG